MTESFTTEGKTPKKGSKKQLKKFAIADPGRESISTELLKDVVSDVDDAEDQKIDDSDEDEDEDDVLDELVKKAEEI